MAASRFLEVIDKEISELVKKKPKIVKCVMRKFL
jgi:hypothetical protein